MLDLGNLSTIYDRFHLSAFVYGRELGMHQQNLTDANFQFLVGWLKHQKVAVVIMFESDHAEYFHRMKETGKDESFDIHTRVAANHLYQALAEDGHRGQSVCDIAWDVSSKGFPTEEDVRSWIAQLSS